MGISRPELIAIIERLLIAEKAFAYEILGNRREVGAVESFDFVRTACLEEVAIKLREEGIIRGDK